MRGEGSRVKVPGAGGASRSSGKRRGERLLGVRMKRTNEEEERGRGAFIGRPGGARECGVEGEGREIDG